MRRLCSRPGCNTSATTIFGFDRDAQAVWLGVLAPEAPRVAGDLCDRHAAALKPPQGWELVDRRPPGPRAEAVATEAAAGAGAPRTEGHSHTPAGGGSDRPAARRARTARPRRTRASREQATQPLPFDDLLPGAEAPAKWVDSTGLGGAGGSPNAQPAVAEAEGVSGDGPAGNGAETERWTPRFDRDDDLDGLLDAKTPLLGRAFRNVRAV